jgi:hypothetical protein
LKLELSAFKMSLEKEKNELKSQGAIQAAQEGSVSPEDAQKVLLDESRKAGAAALTFDPNASPEEKAAQARAVSCRLSAGPYEDAINATLEPFGSKADIFVATEQYAAAAQRRRRRYRSSEHSEPP